MRQIRKSFGPVEVLHGVDFDLRPGEVHVLAGENGAGKSTLIKILSGVYGDFRGEMRIEGRSRRFSNPSQAAEAGVATIHQELSLVPTMSIADNLFLGREMTRGPGWVDFRAQEVEASRILEETALPASPHQIVADLPMAGRQVLEIARALAQEAAVVIFDEPTSALDEHEVRVLFQRIDELKARGCGVVYITHRMEEIYRLADRITVLRDGIVVGTAEADDLSPAELVRWMVGRALADPGATAPVGSPEVVMEVEGLRVDHASRRGRWVVDGIDLTLRKGEILGLAGLQGSGKSEVLHAAFGALGRRASGRVTIGGERLSLRNPRQSMQGGVALLTNDRMALGLAPEQNVLESVSLASLHRFVGPVGWIRRKEERSQVARITSEVRLSTPSLEAPVKILSGGNQQKVYLARCLLAEPRVLLLDEPTRGIDVAAKADIYRLMWAWVDRGGSILLTTSEMDELLTLSHRIIVLHRGRIAAQFDRNTATKDAILAAAMGHVGKDLA